MKQDWLKKVFQCFWRTEVKEHNTLLLKILTLQKQSNGAVWWVKRLTWSIWDTTSASSECRVESSRPRSIYPSKPAVFEMVSGLEISSRKRCMLVHSCSKNWFMKDMYSSLLPNLTESENKNDLLMHLLTPYNHNYIY